MKRGLGLLVCICCLALAACSSGPVRRVYEPTASIQQLTVGADGNWMVELRLQNYSTMPMRFGTIDLEMTLGDESAGTLQGDAGISIGPESADVVTLAHAPTPLARMLMADALSRGRPIDYSFEGKLHATPEDKGERIFKIERDSALSPVPGLPGVLR